MSSIFSSLSKCTAALPPACCKCNASDLCEYY